MKNLVLNNYHEIDMEDRFRKYLKNNFTENQELWTHFNEAFYPENKVETMKRFYTLTSGDNVLCHTVFVDWQQLELMTLLLLELKKKKIKINLYIKHPFLKEKFEKYLNDYESSICPRTRHYDNNCEAREGFKKRMNKKFLEALKYHNVYQLSYYGDEPIQLIKTI